MAGIRSFLYCVVLSSGCSSPIVEKIKTHRLIGEYLKRTKTPEFFEFQLKKAFREIPGEVPLQEKIRLKRLLTLQYDYNAYERIFKEIGSNEFTADFWLRQIERLDHPLLRDYFGQKEKFYEEYFEREQRYSPDAVKPERRKLLTDFAIQLQDPQLYAEGIRILAPVKEAAFAKVKHGIAPDQRDPRFMKFVSEKIRKELRENDSLRRQRRIANARLKSMILRYACFGDRELKAFFDLVLQSENIQVEKVEALASLRAFHTQTTRFLYEPP